MTHLFQNVSSFVIDMSTLKQCMAAHSASEEIQTVSVPQYDSVVDELLSSETKSRLFPQDFFLVWEPYGVLKSNFELCRDMCTMRITRGDNREITSLSLCHLMNTKSGLRMDLENYGGHFELLQSHVIHSLLDLTQKLTDYVGQVFFNVMYPRHIGMDDLRGYVRSLGFDLGEWSTSGEDEYCVVEEKINLGMDEFK